MQQRSRSRVTSRMGALETGPDLREQGFFDSAIVDEQKLGLGDEGARGGRAEPHLGRGIARAEVGGFGQLKALQGFGHSPMPLQARPVGGGEVQVLAQGEVGKERVALEDVTALAQARGHVDAGGGVEQDRIVHQDAAGIGGGKAGQQIEDEGSARLAPAVERGHARSEFEFDIQREGRQNYLAEARTGHRPIRPVSRRHPR